MTRLFLFIFLVDAVFIGLFCVSPYLMIFAPFVLAYFWRRWFT